MVRVLIISALLVLTGCGSMPDDAVGLQIDFTVGERVYDVYVPAQKVNADSGLVILLHGQRSSREDLEGRSRAASPYAQWQRVADDSNLLLLIPQGSEGRNGHAGWNDCRTDADGNPDVDDVAFISAAMAEVQNRWSVDVDRIFASAPQMAATWRRGLPKRSPNNSPASA